MLVLGDSILWGQGLKPEHKSWYYVKALLAKPKHYWHWHLLDMPISRLLLSVLRSAGSVFSSLFSKNS